MRSTRFDQEQIKKLYQQIPENLREALASIELAEKVDEICQKYGVEDTAAIDVVYRLCGDVLLGLLPPEKLEDAVAKEVKVKKDKLSPFMRELHRYILYPYKPELNQLYGARLQQPKVEEDAYIVETDVERAEREQTEKPEFQEAFRKEKKGPDTYRESIE